MYPKALIQPEILLWEIKLWEVIKLNKFKKKVNKFTQISNQVLLDDRLSLKAKGLYSMIQHYITIPDFVLYLNTLKKGIKEGNHTFNSAWKELKDLGYLIQERKRDTESGKFYYEYELVDFIEDNPHTDFPHTDNPHYGKEGVYNNTDLNNTDLNNTNKNIHTSLKNDAHRSYENIFMLNEHITKYTRSDRYIIPIAIFYSRMMTDKRIKHGVLYKNSIERIFNELDAAYSED